MENDTNSSSESLDEINEKDTIREELSMVSFEDLQKLKQKLGAKIYNETVHSTPIHKPKPNFKRVNKNRPREMSSKIKPKPVTHTPRLKQKVLIRDPRFDPLCGTYEAKSFKENYKFVHKMREGEYKQLKKEYEDAEDEEQKRKIRKVMQRLNNQIHEHKKHVKQNKVTQEEKKEIKEKLMRGERPVFKKKSEKKLEHLVQKYEELKKSNKLKKHIERRSRKLARKDHDFISR